jgi:hypothetical protein
LNDAGSGAETIPFTLLNQLSFGVDLSVQLIAAASLTKWTATGGEIAMIFRRIHNGIAIYNKPSWVCGKNSIDLVEYSGLKAAIACSTKEHSIITSLLQRI